LSFAVGSAKRCFSISLRVNRDARVAFVRLSFGPHCLIDFFAPSAPEKRVICFGYARRSPELIDGVGLVGEQLVEGLLEAEKVFNGIEAQRLVAVPAALGERVRPGHLQN